MPLPEPLPGCLATTRVAAFRQSPLVQASRSEVSHGLCVGLSSYWIIRHKNFKTEGSAKRIEMIRANARSDCERAQMAYNNSLTSAEPLMSGQTRSIEAAFAAHGARVTIPPDHVTGVRGINVDPNGCFKEIFNNTAGVHNYYIILFDFKNNGQKSREAHATAAYHSSGKLFGYGSHLYFFEPNMGEFKVAASETAIRTFFADMATAYLGYQRRGTSGGQETLTPEPQILVNMAIDKISVG